NTRYPSKRSAMRAIWPSPSPGSTPTSASRPASIAPTTSSSTLTVAEVTRWIRDSMAGFLGAARQHSRSPRARQHAGVRGPVGYTAPMRPATLASLAYHAAALVGCLPWSWLRTLGDAIAWAWRRSDARESRVARRNLEIAFPDLLPGQRE